MTASLEEDVLLDQTISLDSSIEDEPARPNCERLAAPRAPLLDTSCSGLTIMWSIRAGATHSAVAVQEVGGKRRVFAVDSRHGGEARPGKVPVMAFRAPTARVTVDLPRKRTYVACVSCRDMYGQWSPLSAPSAPEQLNIADHLKVRESVLWTRKQLSQRMQTYICVSFTPVPIQSGIDGDAMDCPVVEPLSQIYGFDSSNPGWLQVGPSAYVHKECFRLEEADDRVRVVLPSVVHGCNADGQRAVCIPVDVEMAVDVPRPQKDRLLMEYEQKCALGKMRSSQKELAVAKRYEQKCASFEQMEWMAKKVEGIKERLDEKKGDCDDTSPTSPSRKKIGGRTFKITLKNDENKRLGAEWDLRLSKCGRKVLETVTTPSLLGDWNAEQMRLDTNLHVKRGDELVAINGHSGGGLLFLDGEMKRAKLALTFFRPYLRAKAGPTRGGGYSGNPTIELTLDACGKSIGMQVDWMIMPPKVLMVCALSDAEKAGIEADDGIQKVQGIQITHANIDELTEHLRRRPLTLLIEKYLHKDNPLKKLLREQPKGEEVYEVVIVEHEGPIGFRLDFTVTPPIALFVQKRSAADKAGMLRGDRILSINGRYVMGLEEREVMHEMDHTRPLTLKMLKGATCAKDDQLDVQLKRHHCAVRIQSFFRRVKAKHFVRNVRLHIAAVKIQAAHRGKRGRSAVQCLRENKAARTLQSVWRGKTSRNDNAEVQAAIKARRESFISRREIAITRIQRKWRSNHQHFIEKRLEYERAKIRAAKRIQARFRGRRSRQKFVGGVDFVFNVTLGRGAPSFLWGIVWDDEFEETDGQQKGLRVKYVLNNSPAFLWNEHCKDSRRLISAGDVLLSDVGTLDAGGLTVVLSFRANPLRMVKYFVHVLERTNGCRGSLDPESSEDEGDEMETFTIVLTRLRPEEDWGFVYDAVTRAIVSVAPDTPADRWNVDQVRVNSGCELRLGTTILTLNGSLWEDWLRLQDSYRGFQLVIGAMHARKVTLEDEIKIGTVELTRNENETWCEDLGLNDDGIISQLPIDGILWRWNHMYENEEATHQEHEHVKVRIGDRLASVVWESVNPAKLPANTRKLHFNVARHVPRGRRGCGRANRDQGVDDVVCEGERFAVTLVRKGPHDHLGLRVNEETGIVRKICKNSITYNWNKLQQRQDSHADIRLGDTVLSYNDVPFSSGTTHCAFEFVQNILRLTLRRTTHGIVGATDEVSGYMSELEKKVVLRRHTGEPWGFALDEDTFTVCSVEEGSIAETAGMKVGHGVSRINGRVANEDALVMLGGDEVTLHFLKLEEASDASSSVNTADLTPFDREEEALEEMEEPERPQRRGRMYFMDVEELRPKIDSHQRQLSLGIVLEGVDPVIVQSIEEGSLADKWNQTQVENKRVEPGDWLQAIDDRDIEYFVDTVEPEHLITELEHFLGVAHFVTFFRPSPDAATSFSMTFERDDPSIPWGFLWDSAFLKTARVRVLRDVKEDSIVALQQDPLWPLERGDILMSVDGDKSCENIKGTTIATFQFWRTATRT